MMYALPYILLAFFYGLLSLTYRTADDVLRKRIYWACGIVFVLFFGLRGFVGTDWTHYYPEFDKVYVGGIRELLYSIERSEFEPGFVVFMALSKRVADSYVFFTLLCSIINVVLLFRFLGRYTDNLPLALMFFMAMSGIGLEINVMRNFISLLIFLNTLQYIEQRRFVPYLCWNLFAMLFHVSSIIYIPLYFLLHRQINKWIFLSIVLLGNVILILKIHFLAPIMLAVASQMGEVYVKMVEVYTEGEATSNMMGISIGLLERVFTSGLIFCYYDKLKSLRKENVIFINSMLLYMFMFFFFSEFEVVCRRLALMFVFAYWILWGDMLKCFTYRGNKLLFAGFLACYSVLKINGMVGDIIYQYDNVLLGAKSYQERLYIYQKNDPDKVNKN